MGNNDKETKLILEDGSKFIGKSFGAEKDAVGEVVFNTGMVGYVEALTDPSYKGQILVFTYPLVGNYGVPPLERDKNEILKYFESEKIQVLGLIISDYSKDYSHWNAVKSLGDWLRNEGIPALFGIDTRKLTVKLREKGTIFGGIYFGNSESNVSFKKTRDEQSEQTFLNDIGVKSPVVYNAENKSVVYNAENKSKILVIDCGVKNSILLSLLNRGADAIRVPWGYNFLDGEYAYDGILISNGPGDPKLYEKTIKHVKKTLEANIPIFGVCLGNQLLALASGGNTYKLKYGHRSQNQPCTLSGTNCCYITSQNHGYAVDIKSLGKAWEPWFINANDGSNEGIKCKARDYIFSVQFHPEANPGPTDTGFLFDLFLKKVKEKTYGAVK